MKLIQRLLRSLAKPKSAVNEGVVIYVTRGCGCCDAAVEALRFNGLEPDIRDLDEHPDTRAEHGGATPIVFFHGRVRFFGRVDPVLLRRFVVNRSRRAGKPS